MLSLSLGKRVIACGQQELTLYWASNLFEQQLPEAYCCPYSAGTSLALCAKEISSLLQAQYRPAVSQVSLYPAVVCHTPSLYRKKAFFIPAGCSQLALMQDEKRRDRRHRRWDPQGACGVQRTFFPSFFYFFISHLFITPDNAAYVILFIWIFIIIIIIIYSLIYDFIGSGVRWPSKHWSRSSRWEILQTRAQCPTDRGLLCWLHWGSTPHTSRGLGFRAHQIVPRAAKISVCCGNGTLGAGGKLGLSLFLPKRPPTDMQAKRLGSFEAVVKFINDGSGKDRCLRLAIYITRLLIWRTTAHNFKDLTSRLQALDKSFNHARRVMRLGKLGNLKQQILACRDKFWGRWLFFVVESMKVLAGNGYLVCDHLKWFAPQLRRVVESEMMVANISPLTGLEIFV